jgi:hypothetical protein
MMLNPQALFSQDTRPDGPAALINLRALRLLALPHPLAAPTGSAGLMVFEVADLPGVGCIVDDLTVISQN